MSLPVTQRGWFRWFVFPMLFGIVLLASVYFVAWSVVHRLGVVHRDRVVKELDASEPLWRSKDFCEHRNAQLPPPEQNASEVAWQAVQLLPKTWQQNRLKTDWTPQLKLPYLAHRGDIMRLKAELADVKPAIELARSVAKLPSGGLRMTVVEDNPFATLLPKEQELRQTAALLHEDCLVQAYERNSKLALDDILAIFATANGIGDEPFLISQLIRMAIVSIGVRELERTLAWCETFDDDQLAIIQDAIHRELQYRRFEAGLRGERAMSFLMLDSLARDPRVWGLLEGNPRTNVLQSVLMEPLKATVPEQQAKLIELLGPMLEAAKAQPSLARTRTLDGFEQQVKTLPVFQNMFLRLLLPAIQKVNEADTRIHAELLLADLALTAERHRLKHGTWPDVSVPLPNDPFSDEPLHIKRHADHAVFYSVGPDGRDDGGVERTGTSTFCDRCFRLFDRKQRRKPPLPRSEEPPGSSFASGAFGEAPRKPAPLVSTPPPLPPRER